MGVHRRVVIRAIGELAEGALLSPSTAHLYHEQPYSHGAQRECDQKCSKLESREKAQAVGYYDIARLIAPKLFNYSHQRPHPPDEPAADEDYH